MTAKKYTLPLLALGCATLFACKKTDREKPTFDLQTPADSSVFISGQTIPFAARFLDNQGLSQYKIDIHDNFDGHSHEKYIAKIWTQILIENIGGTEFNENRSIQVPDSVAAGWYHFLVTAVDEAGNQSEITFRNLYIQNTSDTVKPQITVNSPAEGFSAALGSTLAIDLNLADNEWVYIARITIRRPNSSSNLYLSTDTFPQAPTVPLVKSVPTTGSAWSAGNYELALTVYDSYFNRRNLTIHFSLN